MTITSRHEKERFQQAPKLLDLDAAIVSQTKQQISDKIAEIAAMATKSVELDEYVREMLPRLVSAMAATGAGFWSVDNDGEWSLVDQFNLPFRLFDGRLDETPLLDQVEQLLEDTIRDASPMTRIDASVHAPASSRSKSNAVPNRSVLPSEPHRLLLEQVAKERQPVLIPPGDAAAVDNRPVNPTDQFLIYVPIPVEAILGRWWLQVMQPPSGVSRPNEGICGSLRRLADLAADFIKSHRLREFNQQQQLFVQSEQLLDVISQEQDEKKRLQSILFSLRDLTKADQLFCFS